MSIVRRNGGLAACLLLLLTAIAAPAAAAAGSGNGTPPKYVFFFIGDGMGFEQAELAERAKLEAEDEKLWFHRLPVQGSNQTHSANNPVTDSAAAGTALAGGIKTNNGMLGQTPDGAPVQAIARDFFEAGQNVGILSSVPANHATPAAFYAHVESRHQYSEIADQFDESGIRFLVGRSLNSQDGRKDEIIRRWRANGIAVVDSVADGAAVPVDSRLVVLDENLKDPTSDATQLADAVALGIQRLDGPEGFFMMVEGGAIDWEGHGNQAWENLQETLAFDRAIEVAYRFYEAHPEETLIIATADHETGGLRVDADLLDLAALREVPAHRSALNQILPEDPEAITIEVATQTVGEAMGLQELTASEQAKLAEAVNRDAQHRRNAVRDAAKRIADARAGATWSTGNHTGMDVPIRAIGIGAERFEGTLDNTEIPRRIRQLSFPGQADATGGTTASSSAGAGS